MWKLQAAVAEVRAFVQGCLAPEHDAVFRGAAGKVTAQFEFEPPELLQHYIDASLKLPALQPHYVETESGRPAVEVSLLEDGRKWFAERNQDTVRRLRGKLPLPRKRRRSSGTGLDETVKTRKPKAKAKSKGKKTEIPSEPTDVIWMKRPLIGIDGEVCTGSPVHLPDPAIDNTPSPKRSRAQTEVADGQRCIATTSPDSGSCAGKIRTPSPRSARVATSGGAPTLLQSGGAPTLLQDVSEDDHREPGTPVAARDTSEAGTPVACALSFESPAAQPPSDVQCSPLSRMNASPLLNSPVDVPSAEPEAERWPAPTASTYSSPRNLVLQEEGKSPSAGPGCSSPQVGARLGHFIGSPRSPVVPDGRRTSGQVPSSTSKSTASSPNNFRPCAPAQKDANSGQVPTIASRSTASSPNNFNLCATAQKDASPGFVSQLRRSGALSTLRGLCVENSPLQQETEITGFLHRVGVSSPAVLPWTGLVGNNESIPRSPLPRARKLVESPPVRTSLLTTVADDGGLVPERTLQMSGRQIGKSEAETCAPAPAGCQIGASCIPSLAVAIPQTDRSREEPQKLPGNVHTPTSSAKRTLASSGLFNRANTCYINAVVQAVGVLDKLRKQLIRLPVTDGVDYEGKRVSTALADLIRPVVARYEPYMPSQLVDAVAAEMPAFAGEGQHDVHEFFLALLSLVVKSLQVGLPCNAVGAASLFYSDVTNRITCVQCGVHRELQERFCDFSLDFYGEGMCDVHSMLRSYFQGEIVERTCPQCGCQSARMSKSLISSPQILVLHLKRFAGNGSGVYCIKRHQVAHIPIELDVGDFVQAARSAEPQVHRAYNLQSVIAHTGASLHVGHYVAYARGEDDVWKLFDDEKVHKIPCNLQSLFGHTAYLLFYTARGESAMQDYFAPSAIRSSLTAGEFKQ